MSRESRVLLEAVCSSADDCAEAEAGGADRIELCSAMMVGGLTPSLGTLVEARLRTRLPIVCMIRPRAGGFHYTPGEFAAMRRDAEFALAHGADGIVFGILDGQGAVDLPRCRELVALAASVSSPAGAGSTADAQAHPAAAAADASRRARPGAARQTVFHRAFDVAADPRVALDALISLGITRLLTSGAEPTAAAGAPLITELIARAAGRIEILPGGGLRDHNVADLIRATGARQVHLGPFRAVGDHSGAANSRITFSSQQIPPEGAYPLTDRAALRRARAALDRASLEKTGEAAHPARP